jgi:hypothetical protein
MVSNSLRIPLTGPQSGEMVTALQTAADARVAFRRFAFVRSGRCAPVVRRGPRIPGGVVETKNGGRGRRFFDR